FHRAPDAPSVQAVSYGPVVLAGRGVGGAYATAGAATDAIDNGAILNSIRHPAAAHATPHPPPLPRLDTASVPRTAAAPMTFTATADGHPVPLVPVARATHEPFTVYWQAGPG